MAGGSQILINNEGITITTHGKVVFKAGQHVFQAGQKVEMNLPILPFSQSSPLCALKSKFSESTDTQEESE